MNDWETAPESGWETAPITVNPQLAAQGQSMRGARDILHSGAEFLSSRDPGIDYATGVSNLGVRGGLSFMSGEPQKTSFLDRKFGAGNWGVDSFGAYYAKPEGLAKLGIKATTPISLDEQTISRYDLADLLGDVPTILGGIGGSLAATGLGAPLGLGLAGLGAAGGRAYGELAKNLLGYRQQAPEEIAGDIAIEGGKAAAGEGLFRLLRPVGRFIMGPQAKRMTPERAQLAKEAQGAGFVVRPGQVTDAPLLSRWEGMVNKLFGDLTQEPNKKAAQSYMDDLLNRLGQPRGAKDVGESLSQSIIAARQKFGAQASKYYQEVDDLVGGRPIVSTAKIKQTLFDLTEDMPLDKAGKEIYPTPQLEAFVKKYGEIGDFQTVRQMQQMRTAFREAAYNPDLVPGVSIRHARSLQRAADQALEELKTSPELAKSGAANALKRADAFYKQGIQQFDNPVVTSIIKDASERGAVDPDMVVDYLIKPGQAMRIERIKTLVPPQAWSGVQRAHAEDLVGKIMQKTDDPFLTLFSGRSFETALDSYGRDTLNAVYGKQWVDEAYRLANMLKLVGKTKAQSGGIVAAGIALHPLQNLPKLAYQRALVALVQQPGTFKYLTVGIQAPNTRAGAEALTRLSSMAAFIARDETGSAKVTVTEPEVP